nr:hypothetical protein [Pirellula sp.]
ESDKQLLTSRIEFFGTSNTDLLELELPNGFSVDEVTNRNDKVKVHEREENGVRYAQLVAERSNWENYDFSIRLVKRDLSIETSMPIPWLGVLGSQIMEQTVEVAASKVWRVELVSASATEKILLGQGEEIGLVALMPGDQIRLIPRSPFAKGNLALSQRSSQTDGRIEVVIAGDFDVPSDGMAVAILEIPQLLTNRWRCNVQVLPTACPIVNKAWLKIPLDRRVESAATSQFELSFSLTPEEFNLLQAASDWLRIVNTSEIEIAGNLADMLVQLGREVPSTKSKSSAEWGHYVSLEGRLGAGQTYINILRYWFDTAGQSLQFRVAPESVVQAVRWNGKAVAWSQDSEFVTIQLPVYPSGQWNEIEIVSNASSGSKEEKKGGLLQVVGEDIPVYEIDSAVSSDAELQSRLDNFSKAVRFILAEVQSRRGESINAGSSVAVHSEFWIKRLHETAQRFSPMLSGIDKERLVALQAEIKEASSWFPLNVEFAVSDNFQKIQRTIEPKAISWRSTFGSFFVMVVVLGVLLFTNGKRFPMVTLVFAGGCVWLLTGLWPVFAFICAVVCVVAIDTIWINRLNRRLVR